MATTVLYRKLSMVTAKSSQYNGLVGRFQGGMNVNSCIGMPSRNAMLSKWCVLYIQLLTLVLGSSRQ